MKMKKLLVPLLAVVFLCGCINIYQEQPFPYQVPENAAYSLSLAFSKTTACVGEYVTGSLTSNIPNGGCNIYYNPNNAGWQLYKWVALNYLGTYSETMPMTSVVTASFRAVCCDSSNSCKISNQVPLNVIQCQTTSTFTPTISPTTTTTIPPTTTTTQLACNVGTAACQQACSATGGISSACATDVCPMLFSQVADTSCATHPPCNICCCHYPEVPECNQDSDCQANYFCYNHQCKPRCEDPAGTVRTNYLGNWYSACWDGCGSDRTCCANTYFYYDGAHVNGEQWYYWACQWVEGQRCSNFDPCIAPGGNHP